MKQDVLNQILSEIRKEFLFTKTDSNLLVYRQRESKHWKFFDEFHVELVKMAYKNFSLYLKTSESEEIMDRLTNAFKGDIFSCEEAEVSSGIRLIQRKKALYFDLGGKVIKISKDGIKEIKKPANVAFLRSPAQKPLSDLAETGNILKLKEILGLDDRQWDRLLLFLINAMRPQPPHYMLVLSGPPGSGKTTLASILKLLLDPSIGTIAGMPNKLADLKLMASQSRVLLIDNTGSIPSKAADAICMMCTGGSDKTRTLYTTTDMTISEYNSVLIFTSVGKISERADIQERSINIECNFIRNKKGTDQLMSEFQEHRASIERGLYDIVHAILVNEDYEPVAAKCRMPDVINWAGRAEGYLGLEHGFFAKVAEKCQGDLQSMIASESPLVELINKVMTRLALNSNDPAEFRLEKSNPEMLGLLLDSAPRSMLRDKEMPQSVARFGRVISE
ncbi:MAG: ATP-binding protein, partial [Candidatus Riflebacteria bacterium]|nr:ATP-binding protein [Candidatus Riflebacteria bacterium]